MIDGIRSIERSKEISDKISECVWIIESMQVFEIPFYTLTLLD